MRIKVGDILLGAVIIAAAVFLLVFFHPPKASGAVAVIIRDNQEIERIDLTRLTEPVTIEFGDETGIVIRAEKGRIRFIASNCPDQICVHTGWIDDVGETAVCLPNRVLIRIVGSDVPQGGVDTVAE